MSKKGSAEVAWWWQAAVQRPFEARRPEGRAQLVALLRQVMIRAAKADLITLPRLEYKVGHQP